MTFLFIAANLSYRVGWGHSSTVLVEEQKVAFDCGSLFHQHRMNGGKHPAL